MTGDRSARDALQHFVDTALETEPADDGRDVLIQHVSMATYAWVWRQSDDLHRVLDQVLASNFVQQRYRQLRRDGRPAARDIAELEVANNGQLPLPQLEELMRWRWASRDGKIEKSVAQSTLPEVDALDQDYEARILDMSAKRRYLHALRARWRPLWTDPRETVTDFYRRLQAM